MRRVETDRLLRLAAGLTEIERAAIDVVSTLKLVTHAQLAAVVEHDTTRGSPASAARAHRRMLARLTDRAIVGRLERRVGGLRAGSAGYAYYLGPVGHRLVAHWNGDGNVRGRVRPKPGERFVRHRLAVSALYVDVRRLVATGEARLGQFETEPDCWISYVDERGGDRLLKPDASVEVVGDGDPRRFLLEVDLATESRPVIVGKLLAYRHYFASCGAGPKDRPRVLLLTPLEARRRVLADICRALPADERPWFAASSLEDGASLMMAGTRHVLGATR